MAEPAAADIEAHARLDRLVDTDPIALRNEAFQLLRDNARLRAENERLFKDHGPDYRYVRMEELRADNARLTAALAELRVPEDAPDWLKRAGIVCDCAEKGDGRAWHHWKYHVDAALLAEVERAEAAAATGRAVARRYLSRWDATQNDEGRWVWVRQGYSGTWDNYQESATDPEATYLDSLSDSGEGPA